MRVLHTLTVGNTIKEVSAVTSLRIREQTELIQNCKMISSLKSSSDRLLSSVSSDSELCRNLRFSAKIHTQRAFQPVPSLEFVLPFLRDQHKNQPPLLNSCCLIKRWLTWQLRLPPLTMVTKASYLLNAGSSWICWVPVGLFQATVKAIWVFFLSAVIQNVPGHSPSLPAIYCSYFQSLHSSPLFIES